MRHAEAHGAEARRADARRPSAALQEGAPMTKEDQPMSSKNPQEHVITTYRAIFQSKEVAAPPEPAGDWYWGLDDGNLDMGPYIDERAAFEAAMKSLHSYYNFAGASG